MSLLACRYAEDLPVVAASSVKEEDAGVTLDQPSPIDPLDAVIAHLDQGVSKRSSSFAEILVEAVQPPRECHAGAKRRDETHGSSLSTSIGADLYDSGPMRTNLGRFSSESFDPPLIVPGLWPSTFTHRSPNSRTVTGTLVLMTV